MAIRHIRPDSGWRDGPESRSHASPPPPRRCPYPEFAGFDEPVALRSSDSSCSGSYPTAACSIREAIAPTHLGSQRFHPCAGSGGRQAGLRTEQECRDDGALLPFPPRLLLTGTRSAHRTIAAPAHALPRRRREPSRVLRPCGSRPDGGHAIDLPPPAVVAIAPWAEQQNQLHSTPVHSWPAAGLVVE